MMAKRTLRPRASKAENAAKTQSTGSEPIAEAADRKAPRRRKVTPSASTDEIVRVRAYYRFLARGTGPGDALSDWVEAEHDLRGHELS